MTLVNVVGALAGWCLVCLAIYSQIICKDYVLKRYPLLFLATGLAFIASNISDGTAGVPEVRSVELTLYLLVIGASAYILLGLHIHENEGVELPLINAFYDSDYGPPLSDGGHRR